MNRKKKTRIFHFFYVCCLVSVCGNMLVSRDAPSDKGPTQAPGPEARRSAGRVRGPTPTSYRMTLARLRA